MGADPWSGIPPSRTFILGGFNLKIHLESDLQLFPGHKKRFIMRNNNKKWRHTDEGGFTDSACWICANGCCV